MILPGSSSTPPPSFKSVAVSVSVLASGDTMDFAAFSAVTIAGACQIPIPPRAMAPRVTISLIPIPLRLFVTWISPISSPSGSGMSSDLCAALR